MAITETTTVAELMRMPLAERAKVIPMLFSDAEPALSRRYGPFGNVFIRPMYFPQIGSVLKGHTHNYDHVTWLSGGSVLVRHELPGGEKGERVYRARCPILIKKGVVHEFTALTEGVEADCIYALRDLTTGEVIEHWDGGLEAYQ